MQRIYLKQKKIVFQIFDPYLSWTENQSKIFIYFGNVQVMWSTK